MYGDVALDKIQCKLLFIGELFRADNYVLKMFSCCSILRACLLDNQAILLISDGGYQEAYMGKGCWISTGETFLCFLKSAVINIHRVIFFIALP